MVTGSAELVPLRAVMETLNNNLNESSFDS